MLTPTLLDTNDCEGHDGANDEQPDDGHDPIKIAPPSGALIPRLVDGLLESVGGMRRLEVRLLAVVGIGRDRKERGNHPGKGKNEANGKEHHLGVPLA
jgi:hypothetical protein